MPSESTARALDASEMDGTSMPMLSVDKRSGVVSVSCNATTGCRARHASPPLRGVLTKAALAAAVEAFAQEIAAAGWQMRVRAGRTSPNRADWACSACANPKRDPSGLRLNTGMHMMTKA